FLDGPEQLRPVAGAAADRIYVADGAATRLGGYHALLIEQPEVLFHPDSRYKGIEPDALERLADDLATLVTTELQGSYEITDKAGPGVLHVRWALTDLQLKYRWSKNPLSYTPVGAVANEVGKALGEDVTKKAALKGVTIELEVLDGQTGERLAAMVESRHRRHEPTSWTELEEMVRTFGKRLECRLDNARLPRGQWIDCVETLVESAES
ncbi:MAG: DUF3313 domain-containing protein, partial [Holophagales bacterium]|nr:DUF3313 domain-containing protein [Holophagales bacterium]